MNQPRMDKIKVISNGVYIKGDRVFKRITFRDHPWSPSGLIDQETLFKRVMCAYKYFNDNNLCPKIYNMTRNGDCILIEMELIKTKMCEAVIEKHEDLIRSSIESLHQKGVYHGDLHGDNIAIREDGTLVFLDLDTVFFDAELSPSSPIYPVIKWWAEGEFDMSIEELISYELEENWKNVV